MTDRGILIVIGAGASRELGPPGQPLPLMAEWADIVRAKTNAYKPGLADDVGLDAGLTAFEFEERMGEISRWKRGGPRPAYATADHMDLPFAYGAINESIYACFGGHAIDHDRTADAYRQLLERLDSPASLLVATTNFDLTAEIGLRAAGLEVTTGMEADQLRPQNLAQIFEQAGQAAVLHLHGAVGWYRKDPLPACGSGENWTPPRADRVVPGDTSSYDSRLGDPAVELPDPEKAPHRRWEFEKMWCEFGEALKKASRVIVIGHQLNDIELVDRLGTFAETRRLIVGVHPADTRDEGERTRLRELLPEARLVGLTFGPELRVDEAEWEEAWA